MSTHDDLDALFIDSLPQLHKRVGQGWDLLSKQNLLLSAVPSLELIEVLADRLQDNSTAVERLTVIRLLATSDERSAEQQRDELERLSILRVRELLAGHDTSRIDERLVALKRALRHLPQLQEGELLGDRYKLLSVVGKGGFARVYQGFDLVAKLLVAIKVLHSEASDDQRSVERFERDARKMQQLTHPHVVRVLGGPSVQDGFHYFVMEYLHGGDLHHAVCAGMLSSLDKLRVLLEIGSALQLAHGRLLIHRDIKPENILLDHNGCAYLSDFDLVHAPDSSGGTRNRALGTYIYAAPEQLENASQVTPSADVYSVAMLTAFVLYGRSLPGWVRDERAYFLNGLAIPDRLKLLLRCAMQPDPRARPSIGEFCEQLKAGWEPEDQLGTPTVLTFDGPPEASPESATLPSTASSATPPPVVVTPASLALERTSGRGQWHRRALLGVGTVAGAGLLWIGLAPHRPPNPFAAATGHVQFDQQPSGSSPDASLDLGWAPTQPSPADGKTVPIDGVIQAPGSEEFKRSALDSSPTVGQPAVPRPSSGQHRKSNKVRDQAPSGLKVWVDDLGNQYLQPNKEVAPIH